MKRLLLLAPIALAACSPEQRTLLIDPNSGCHWILSRDTNGGGYARVVPEVESNGLQVCRTGDRFDPAQGPRP